MVEGPSSSESDSELGSVSGVSDPDVHKLALSSDEVCLTGGGVALPELPAFVIGLHTGGVGLRDPTGVGVGDSAGEGLITFGVSGRDPSVACCRA